MPGAIGSSTAALEAQRLVYQKQLADASCCSSAQTQAGKREIQQLTGELAAIDKRIEQVQAQSKSTESDTRLGRNIDVFV